ncbi:hypothetical protein ACTXT7_003273 [Hymenolepis weldensis]
MMDYVEDDGGDQKDAESNVKGSRGLTTFDFQTQVVQYLLSGELAFQHSDYTVRPLAYSKCLPVMFGAY